MNAFVPQKSDYQKLKEQYDAKLVELVKLEHSAAINLAIVTRMQADIDEGFDPEDVVRAAKRWRSYIDSVHNGNVTLQEIKESLEEECGIDLSWMESEEQK